MKKYSILFFIISGIACNSIKQADRLANKQEVNIVYPETVFDSVAAKKLMAYGNSAIKGLVYKKINKLSVVGGKQYGSNIVITLFPVTPYLMDWYNLREKRESKRTKVYIADHVARFRFEVVSDAYGRFVFDKIKPGKYFIQAFMTTIKNLTRDVEVGANSYGTKFYQKQQYSVSKGHRLEQFIEISKEGEVQEVVLK